MPAITTWLTALTAWPLPAGPKWVIVLPIAARTGWARSTSAGSPPTKIVSVAFLAPSDPPETGASTNPTPRSRRRAANPAVAAGEIVEQSMTRPPAASPSATPSGPNSTASTSGVSDTQVTTTSAARAASDGVAASAAPSATRSAARPGVRFQTVTSKPARRRFAAMAAPMVPSPTNAMRSTRTSCCEMTSVAGRGAWRRPSARPGARTISPWNGSASTGGGSARECSCSGWPACSWPG